MTCDSGPSPSSSSRAVLHCLLWHSIHFVVCFHVLEDKQMLKMWTTRFVTWTQIFIFTRTRTLRWWLGLGLRGHDSWLGLKFLFSLGLGLWGDDSDSDSEVMTRTRTRILQPGFGHSTDLRFSKGSWIQAKVFEIFWRFKKRNIITCICEQ